MPTVDRRAMAVRGTTCGARSRRPAAGFLLVALLGCGGVALGNPGDIDTRFGTGGRTFLNMDANAEAAASLIQQSDGKLLIGRATQFNEETSEDLSVIRLNEDGTPDGQFGGGGMVSTDVPGVVANTALALPAAGGKVIVAGPAWPEANPDQGLFAVARFNADGRLDTGFGNGGYVLDDFGASDAVLGSLVVLPNGCLLTAGGVSDAGGNDMAFTRFNADGSLDATFGSQGRMRLDFFDGAGGSGSVNALAVWPDGRVLAVGKVQGATDLYRAPALVALKADGTLDTSFGQHGRATPGIGAGHMSGGPWIGLQSDGSIVLATQVYDSADDSCALSITRMNSLGQPDPTFGLAGYTRISLISCDWHIDEVHVSSDDQILFVETTALPSPWDYGSNCPPCDLVVGRLTANGMVDGSFGGNGAARVDFGTNDWLSNGFGLPGFSHVTMMSDDAIAVATTGQFDDEYSVSDGESWFHPGIAVARLLGSGGSPGLIGFDTFGPLQPEYQSPALLTVRRSGGSSGIVSVDYSTSDSTATAGADYVPSSGTLTWTDGDTADKTIAVTLLDDSVSEGDERFNITLANPTGGAFLATSRSSVMIADDDPAPPPTTPSPVTSQGVGQGGGGSVGPLMLAALLLLLTVKAANTRDAVPGHRRG
jgi:uncharacterized delta-60 repeat protein